MTIPRAARAPLVALITLLLLGGALVAFENAAGGGVAVDYLSFATGGRAIADHPAHVYENGVQAEEQAALLGYRPPAGATNFPALFVNPPFAAEIIRPFAALPLQAGTDLFCLLLLIAMAAIAWVTWRRECGVAVDLRLFLAVTTGFSVAASYAIILGQWSPLLGLAATGAVILCDSGKPFWAGVVLSILLLKPQTVWLVPAGLILLGQWRLLAGFALAGLVLALWSVAAVGIPEALHYVPFTVSFEGAAHVIKGHSIPGLIAQWPPLETHILVISIVLGVVALGLLWWARDAVRHNSARSLAVVLAISVCTAAHANIQDFAVLSVALLVFAAAAPRRVVALSVALNLAVFLSVWGVPLYLDTLVLIAGSAVALHAARQRHAAVVLAAAV